jgi:hypothetical protein
MDACGEMRVGTSGRRLTRGGRAWFMRGVCYGPFAGGAAPAWFRREAELARDLDAIAAAGFNTIRTYHPPDEGFLNDCAERGLAVLAGFPWSWHIDFHAEFKAFEAAREGLRRVVAETAGHPALAGWIVANEIEGTLVRWLGTDFTRRALERLVEVARAAAPDAILLYATYPPTGWLVPGNADVAGFNIYLESREAFAAYLHQAHHLAGDLPLLVTECGLDRLAHGGRRQAQWLEQAFGLAAELGAAGLCWFTWSDDWRDPRGGMVQGWKFGLTDESGRPHRALATATRCLPLLEGRVPLPAEPPMVSVLVCSRNGGQRLLDCLASLASLAYPRYEVVVVDDGSTDGSAGRVLEAYPHVRLVSIAPSGLSVARNTAAEAARGEFLAFIDDDCLAERQWLDRMVHGMLRDAWDAAGGPNLAPPARSPLRRTLDSLPGTAFHVMLDDRRAEHVPGCNLVVRRAALAAVGGFDPRYHTAGDDVDFCWRLLDAGLCIGFVPDAALWHLRRATPWAYLRQQLGYGRAEALLAAAWPQRCGPAGVRWRGLIYGPPAELDGIRRGPFGYADFPGIYPRPGTARPPPGLGAGWRILHAALSWMQPQARALGRRLGGLPAAWPRSPACRTERPRMQETLLLWHPAGRDRQDLLPALAAELEHENACVGRKDGWRDWDLAVDFGTAGICEITTVTEYDEKPGRVTRLRLAGPAASRGRASALVQRVARNLGFEC